MSSRGIGETFHEKIAKSVWKYSKQAEDEEVNFDDDFPPFVEMRSRVFEGFNILNNLFHRHRSQNLLDGAAWLNNLCIEEDLIDKDEDLWDQFPPLLWRQPENKDRINVQTQSDEYLDDNRPLYKYPPALRGSQYAELDSESLVGELEPIVRMYATAARKNDTAEMEKALERAKVMFLDLRACFMVHRSHNILEGADWLSQFWEHADKGELWAQPFAEVEDE